MMATATTKLTWVPVRRGSVYCSPACGHGCELGAYTNARRRANQLARHLNLVAGLGGGWTPDVCENLGWFWSAKFKKGHLNVSPHNSTGLVLAYSAYLSYEPGSGGNWVGRGQTPEAAVRDALLQARAQYDRIADLLAVVKVPR